MKKKSILLLASLLCLASCENPNNSSDSLNSDDSQSSVNVDSSESEQSSESSSLPESFEPDNTSSESSESSDSTESSPSSESSSSSEETDEFTWNVDTSQFGNTFRITLGSAINALRTKTISYSECLSVGAKAAAYPTMSSNTFVPFYHDESKTVTIGSCNREHTWPNSRGSKKSGPGADPFIIRPTLSSENSSRGNYFYGISSSNEWDPASCGFEAARGESARVILYAATAYYKSHGFELSNNPGDSASKKTMGTLKTLLEWNKKYAPTKIEKQINNYLYKNKYGRNPFVDHPEYANLIWNTSGIVTSETAIEEF